MSINKVCISGNLGRDPELKVTQGGTQLCKFCICVNDRRLNKQTNEWEDVPNWVDVTFFGNRAESIHKYLAKGMLVFVSGRLHQNTWENKDGQKRSKLEVIGDDIQFGSGNKQQGQRQPQQGYQYQNAPQQGYQQPQQPNYASQAPQGYQYQNAPQQGYQQPAQPDYGYQEQMPVDSYGDVYDEDIPF